MLGSLLNTSALPSWPLQASEILTLAFNFLSSKERQLIRALCPGRGSARLRGRLGVVAPDCWVDGGGESQAIVCRESTLQFLRISELRWLFELGWYYVAFLVCIATYLM